MFCNNDEEDQKELQKRLSKLEDQLFPPAFDFSSFYISSMYPWLNGTLTTTEPKKEPTRLDRMESDISSLRRDFGRLLDYLKLEPYKLVEESPSSNAHQEGYRPKKAVAAKRGPGRPRKARRGRKPKITAD